MARAFEQLIQSLRMARQTVPGGADDPETRNHVFRLILGYSCDCARDEDIAALFSSDFFPGTFTIGEIQYKPDFLCRETSIGYEPWIRREIQREIEVIRQAGGLDIDDNAYRGIDDKVIEILYEETAPGNRLCDIIALQEYTDIFRRVILALLVGMPEHEVQTFAELNRVGGDIALKIVSVLDEHALPDLLKMSLAAGLIGLNLKTSAAATSHIHKKGIIPLNLRIPPEGQVERVFDSLTSKTGENLRIDYWGDYEKRVLSGSPANLVVFTDDYIETVFDLKLIERQLEQNPRLRVSVIPRALCCGNDASYADVKSLLGQPVFRKLESLSKSGRLYISPDGPRVGTVNGLRISQSVANLLKCCDAVLVKGARAYEMLQGLGKPTYYGFAVCRELSEAVTGIDAESGALVFIHQRPYQRTFLGFRQRRERSHRFQSETYSFLCPITANDIYQEDLMPSFYRDLCDQGRVALHERRIEFAPFLDNLDQDMRRGLTLVVRPSSEVTERLENVMGRLRSVAPNNFFYESSRLHFTIVSLITAYEAFDIRKIPLDLYAQTIRDALRLFPPFEVKFAGVGATQSSLIAKGFPVGGTCEAIRNVLRERLRSVGLGNGVDGRYPCRGAHITLARFKSVQDSETLVACLEELSETPLGRMRVCHAELLINDFYMSPSKVKSVSQMSLLDGLEIGAGGTER